MSSRCALPADGRGYLNGGVETGERVANLEILADYKAGIFP